jgi:dihydrofolate synthase / folylpolyglutamate synthase
MVIEPIKTNKISSEEVLTAILDKYLIAMEEHAILAITSKIVAITEGAMVPIDSIDKSQLIEQEADYFLPASHSQFNLYLTIKNNILIPNAGIDESNSNGHYILWPKDPQAIANTIRSYLVERFKHSNIGVIITDSKTTPLRRGTIGVAMAHSGFQALHDYIGEPDIYGNPLRMTKANIGEGLAAAAVMMMGEGNEQTPLAMITEAPSIVFQDRNPNDTELAALSIALEDDLYSPILSQVKWKKKY